MKFDSAQQEQDYEVAFGPIDDRSYVGGPELAYAHLLMMIVALLAIGGIASLVQWLFS